MMILINQLFFAVLISSVTSTLLFFVWWLLRGFFMIANAKLVYSMLRSICILYVLPIGYVAVLLTYQAGFRGKSGVWSLVFARSKELTNKLWLYAVLWTVTVIFLIAFQALDRLQWRRKLADNIPEYNQATVKLYESVCQRLGVANRMMPLNRNVEIDIPCVIGWIRPRLLLPERDYSREELELIFLHEVSHHKHKDLGFKAFSVVVMMVHCFNPAAWILVRKINFWSECMADLEVLEMNGSLQNEKAYFDSIAKLIPDDKKKQVNSAFVSALCISRKMIDRRVDFVKKYRLMKSAGKLVTAALGAAFILASGTTAYASGKTVADLHNVVYRDTENYVNVEEGSNIRTVVADDGMIEYHCRIEDLDREGLRIVNMPDEEISSIAADTNYIFDWYVDPECRYVSGSYYVTTSQRLGASVTVMPMDKYFDLGIMDDHGNAYYVRSKGVASHMFNIPESSRYRVFIQNNNSSTTLHATGSYGYEDK